MAYIGKTNWQNNEIVEASDMNRIEQGILDIDAELGNVQTELDGKVDNSRVLTDVPANAKFTDTIYTHPASHPASIIVQDANNRFVTDAEKSTWNGKQDALGYTPVPNTRKVNSKALSSDITLSASDVGAAATSHSHGNITADGKIGTTANLPVFAGTGGLLETKSAENGRLALGAAKYLEGTGTISTSWSGPDAQGYYTRTVTATGVLGTDKVDITRVLNVADKAASDLIQEAWNLVSDCVISTNTLTFYAAEKPSVAIPIQWKVVR